LKTLDLTEASALLQMSREVLRRKAKTGDIPGAKPGRHWIFLESALAEYSEKLCKPKLVAQTPHRRAEEKS